MLDVYKRQSFSLLSKEDFLQIVYAGGLARQQPRHVQRAVDEDLAAGGPVCDLKLLIRPEEMDGVRPGHGAAPQGVDTHLPGIPAAAVALPAINRREGMGRVQRCLLYTSLRLRAEAVLT